MMTDDKMPVLELKIEASGVVGLDAFAHRFKSILLRFHHVFHRFFRRASIINTDG